jgi:NADH-quinone oxidoreductase subunit E
VNKEELSRIIDKYDGERGGLISMLEEIQILYGYLPEAALRRVAEKTEQSLVDIYGVATFYKAFSLKPKGKHKISVCLGTACHIRGAVKVSEEFERQVGIGANETTQDGEFSLETVNCLGACALGPIAVADGRYFSNVSPEKVKAILKQTIAGIETDERIFPIEAGCLACGKSLMDESHPIDGRASIKVMVSFDDLQSRLWLSSLYGSYSSESEHEIPSQTIVDFSCPHCRDRLTDSSPCSVCEAPLVKMKVPGGGMVYICSRKGCKNHLLDLNGDHWEHVKNYGKKPIQKLKSR